MKYIYKKTRMEKRPVSREFRLKLRRIPLRESVQIPSYLWSVFSCVRIEYGDLRSKSPYSIRIQENAD